MVMLQVPGVVGVMESMGTRMRVEDTAGPQKGPLEEVVAGGGREVKLRGVERGADARAAA